ncbi:uncharacterized protein LOC130720041 [Lotus japonicus]|uniref:uncharacterized protein LOC130720041 n=1 Tax=Lotus japonicus TaxID=34305 RepID=UPI00258FFDE1|nr:uncharacterized protein LOC130720041 [Lotus japonicus]
MVLFEIMGGGGLLRNHTGKWLSGFMFKEVGGSSFGAQAKALHVGLRLAWDHGYRKLVCNSHNKELVRTLSASGSVQDQVHDGTVREIREAVNGDWRVDLSWCRREGLVAADWLAQTGAMLLGSIFRLLEFPPPELEVLLLRDSLWVG